jgi:hypothetical protein
MPNIEIRPKKDVSSFRRIAIGTWRTAYDPSVYGNLVLNVGEALRYIEAFREATGRRITISHMMAKAVAQVLHEFPDANAILRFNRIYLRDRIGVFFQVALEDESGEIDLSGAVIMDAEKKSVLEIIDEFEKRVGDVRSKKDKSLENARSTFKKIPYFLLNRFVSFLGFLGWTLNLDLSWAGVAKDPFGSVMITNIGSLGLDEAYVPLVPYSRVPLLIATGAVKDGPVVEDGEVKVAKVMKVCATFDHRVLDGVHAAAMSKILRRWFENPFEHFDDIEEARRKAAGGAESDGGQAALPEKPAETPGEGVDEAAGETATGSEG